MGFFKKKNKEKDPPPPPEIDPDEADEELQKYREKSSHEVSLKQYEKGEIVGKEQRKKKWIFLGILVTLAIIAIAVGGAVAGKNKNSTESTEACTPCSDIPTPFMQADGYVCSTFHLLPERCNVPTSWWFENRDWDDDWVDPQPPQTYCQYSCFKAGLGYPDFNNCCADVVAAEFDEPEAGEEPFVKEEPAQEEPAPEVVAVDDNAACVPCSDIPTETMEGNGVDCASFRRLEQNCGVPGSWWFDARDWDDDWVDPYPPQTYCRYSCDKAGVGYPDFSPCCDDVVETPDVAVKEEACTPCSDIADEDMQDDGVDCSTFDRLDENCGVPGSWWFDARDWDDDWVDPYPPQTYCQYSCFQAGVPYPDFNNCCADVVE